MGDGVSERRGGVGSGRMYDSLSVGLGMGVVGVGGRGMRGRGREARFCSLRVPRDACDELADGVRCVDGPASAFAYWEGVHEE